ncbi:MAG TPA: acyl carrier protein [Clostridia bacterium]
MNKRIEWYDFVEKVSEYTGISKDEINEKTNIYIDIGMDSLGLFSLGMNLMKIYNITIPLSSVAAIETIYDIYTMMSEVPCNE